MKLNSLITPRTENLGVQISLHDFKKIMNNGQKKFHFKWLTENSFAISLNFSFGTNILFDINYPGTKSDIIFYGSLFEKEESKTEIVLKTKSKAFLIALLIILPLLVIIFQILIKMDFPIFLVTFLLFPLLILGVLSFIKSEENRLLGMFKKNLNNELNSLVNKTLSG
ncbi:hypothetical protein [Flagellimonas sp. W118]|uniref:hypothetical protein n=1 Tax=Flagellimonas sp. W118 TaxID=3410791 RepID=UPI003BF4DEC2